MIASVKGKVLVRRPDHVVVECGGVGYKVNVSSQALKSVPGIGKETLLQTHLVPKEDAFNLYGFASEEERELFLMLLSVAGVGPKVAVSVLSQMAPRDLFRAIASSDTKLFKAVPGVGRKTAERIIVELRDEVAGRLPEVGSSTESVPQDERMMARDGLVELGYTVIEAESMLDGIGSEAETVEEIISRALSASTSATGKA